VIFEIQITFFIKRTEYPLGLAQKNLDCGAFYLIGLACGTFCFITNLACGTFFPYKIFSNRDAFDLKFLVLSTNPLVMKMIPTATLSDNNDTICTKQ